MDKDLKDQIRKIYNSNKGRYGYPRITLELKKQGYKINHKRIQRLMKLMNLKAINPRAKYKSYKGEVGKTCKNMLLDKVVDTENHKTTYKRNFKTTGVNQKWTTDVSEFHIAAGKLYSISRSSNFEQTKAMLKKAFKKFDNLSGLIFHSDQGWQYQMNSYQQMLKEKGIIQSMSRKGNCLDNSLMENFFGILKNEMFYGHEYEFKTLDQLEEAIVEYINYYNNNRITVKLKGLSPIQYRQQSLISVISN